MSNSVFREIGCIDHRGMHRAGAGGVLIARIGS
jgi:hypothetical protein